MGQNDLGTNTLEQILGERFGIEILNAMGIAIVVLDPEFNIVWANREYRKLQCNREKML